jgi:hypothetical protein
MAAILEPSFCNMKCPSVSSGKRQAHGIDDAKHKTCGGYFAIEVFETGVIPG